LNRLSKKTFLLWQALGLHITPNRYDEPIPDTRELSETLWSQRSELVGIDMNAAAQLGLLARFVAQYKDEYDRFPLAKTSCPYEYHVNNTQFESVDGEILYSMVRDLRPRKIVEIGSGFSTFLSAQAALKNRENDPDFKCELIAIEPYPSDVLRAGFPGFARLIETEVQQVPLGEFAALQPNDILFIDSSHVLKLGSDVQYEYLEVLPRIPAGVVVHVHDIFLPSEYPEKYALEQFMFPNEQYIVQAFLIFNDTFEVLWSSSFMHINHPAKLETAVASYRRTERWPGSLWMRRRK
jgi:hypothetical protein